MRAGRLVCAVLTVLVLLAAGCGGGDGDNAGGGGDSTTENGGDGDGGNGGEDDEDSESEFTLDTELNLGQAFAEDPMFEKTLGVVTVNALADRGGGSNAQVPITFRLTNSGQEDLEDVAVTIRFTVQPSDEPEDPPVPAPDDPPLELAPQTTVGTCVAEDTTSSSTAIACKLGTLAGGAEATITATSPQWFRFSIGMKLTTRGP
jgi:hypothetical protein